MSSSTSSREKLDLIHTTVLYDKNNGKIIHMHQEVFFANAKIMSQQQIEVKVLDLAKNSTGCDTSKLAILHLQNAEINPSLHYNVDIKTKKLVESEN
jgi:hypothetical protein